MYSFIDVSTNAFGIPITMPMIDDIIRTHIYAIWNWYKTTEWIKSSEDVAFLGIFQDTFRDVGIPEKCRLSMQSWRR